MNFLFGVLAGISGLYLYLKLDQIHLDVCDLHSHGSEQEIEYLVDPNANSQN